MRRRRAGAQPERACAAAHGIAAHSTGLTQLTGQEGARRAWHALRRAALTRRPLASHLPPPPRSPASACHCNIADALPPPRPLLSWFDFDVTAEAGSAKILRSEEEGGVVTKLHLILKPFLLRRLKADVDLSIPPKHE